MRDGPRLRNEIYHLASSVMKNIVMNISIGVGLHYVRVFVPWPIRAVDIVVAGSAGGRLPRADVIYEVICNDWDAGIYSGAHIVKYVVDNRNTYRAADSFCNIALISVRTVNNVITDYPVRRSGRARSSPYVNKYAVGLSDNWLKAMDIVTQPVSTVRSVRGKNGLRSHRVAG